MSSDESREARVAVYAEASAGALGPAGRATPRRACAPALSSDGSREARVAGNVEALAGVIGHAGRATPLRDYCTGLLMPAGRKSVEPMAAITAPARGAGQRP